MKISMIPNKIVKLIHASKGDTSLRKWAFEPYDNNGAINVSNIKDQLVYKTENGGTEQLLPVNTSTPTTSYFDGTINYGTDTDVEFTYKQSSYTGQARIKSIKGNTLVWNQLIDIDFTTTELNGITVTPNGKSFTVTGTATATASIKVGTIKCNGGHIIYRNNGCGVNGATSTFRLDFRSDPNTVVSTMPTNETVGEIAQDGTYDLYVRVANGYQIDLTFTPQMFDLTMLFGSGNEPSTVNDFLAWKNAYFPLNIYAYNSGSLLNFNGTGIKTYDENETEISTLSLPISAYFPTGMKNVDFVEDVHDEMTDSKAITRVQQVDLGSLTYTKSTTLVSGVTVFYSSPIDGRKTNNNLKCAKYEIGSSRGNLANMDKAITGYNASSTNVVIRDDSLASGDANAFKTAMNGVYLNYELATYTETDIQNASLVCKNIEVPCYLSNGNLVCDATEELTNESGFFDAKLKIKDSSSVAYSSKFKLHVEDL